MTGAYGELVTGRYLRDEGFTIVTANYRSRFGEIDIIAQNKKLILFVEVKTRTGEGAIRAMDAVDEGKQKRIAATAEHYLAKYKTKLQPRFDVAEVYLDGDTVQKFNYIKNAYTLT